MTAQATTRPSLTRFAWLSIAAAVLTIGLKTAAYFVTGSVGLLSDALESVVNLVGALMALAMLIIAARPADEEHAFGHSKAEYFSSGVEGALILVAAATIAIAAIRRLMNPEPLEQVGIGLVVSIVASLINLGVALVLLRAGRRYDSITLQADARHLLTDVWTSVGVVAGIAVVALTGWLHLDPLIALAVAANIVRSGYHIVRESIMGLMDTALPANEQEALQATLKPYTQAGIQFHALRTRKAGSRRFVSLHVLVPGQWTVQRGHDLLEQIETGIRAALANTTVFTHIEPLDDAIAWEDVSLDRSAPTLDAAPATAVLSSPGG